MILIGSTTLLIISILVWVFAKQITEKCSSTTDSESLVVAGMVGTAISCIVGFILLGFIVPVETKNIQIEDYKFVEGKYYYMLETPDKLIELDDGKIINAMLKYDNPLLYKKIKVNSYRKTVGSEYIVKPRKEVEEK